MKTDNQIIEDFWVSQGGKPHLSADISFYESDWNMLIPVVEMIESFVNQHRHEVGNLLSEWTYWYKVFNGTVNTDIAVTYQVVVEFIKWYNQQPK